ncbi:rab GTPase-activating protein 22-like [Coffea arabica]|uniref:Rab GTPase-activating protein 22-like n=1 Tax=Coffea arabica TaxID=13443 RepID=A0ABM4VCZ3_COFAR
MVFWFSRGFGRRVRRTACKENPTIPIHFPAPTRPLLVLLPLLLLMFDIFSGGDGRRRGGIIGIFAEAGGGGGGGGGFWGFPSSSVGLPASNVGIAIVVTAMAGLALAATVVYSRRGSLKSPWSRRRRKHALLQKQWKSFFDTDGRLLDGGVKFLKKARSGGVDPNIRAEVWPFLLGVYDVNSTEEERNSIKARKRKEYVNLRRQCQQLLSSSDKSFKSKETSGNDSNEDSGDFSQVGHSRGLEDVVSGGSSIPMEELSPACEDRNRVRGAAALKADNLLGGQDSDEVADTLKAGNSLVEHDGDHSGIANENASEPETASTDSESSEDPEETQPFIAQEGTEKSYIDEGSECCHHKSAGTLLPPASEDFATWQRIIRLDAVRANGEWLIYSPSQASVSEVKARRLAESVGLKDYDHLEPCRIYHAARLVAILEAYSLYDSEIGYCQGMSDLLSPIISVVEEDHEAFWCFVGFMRKARHNFRLDEVGIRRQLNIVSKIIKCKDSHLYRHLEKLQAEDCFFVYRMVVVLFRRELNFEQTLCLWEVMWADQAAIRAGIAKSAWGRLRMRAPPTEDLLLYAIAACVLQRRKLIIEKYSSMDEIMRECNSMAGNLDVWKLLDDAHDLVVNLHDKI